MELKNLFQVGCNKWYFISWNTGQNNNNIDHFVNGLEVSSRLLEFRNEKWLLIEYEFFFWTVEWVVIWQKFGKLSSNNLG